VSVTRLALIGAFPVHRPPRGGVESANRALIELLLERDPKLEVDVLTVGDGELERRQGGRLRVHARLPQDYRLARLRGFPREKSVIKDFVNTLEPETVVHATGPLAMHAMAAARERGLPCVFTVHGILENDVKFERHLSPWMRALLAWRMKPMTRSAALAATRAVAISSFSADYLRGLGRRGEIPVIPNPLDRRFEGVNHVPRPHGTRLLFVGNIQPLKGLHTLLEALPKIKVRIPAVSLHIAGPVLDDVYAATLHDQARTLGLEDAVVWLGSLDKPTILQEMLAADALVLPSQTENLSQALQEAGSIGLPFVASNVGGIKDLVPHGLEGDLLVEPHDAAGFAARITRLLEDDVHKAQIASGLKAHMHTNFSNERVATQTLALYETVLLETKTPSSTASSRVTGSAR
jgi:glycosyltransferase involved in cell wall biosynthesis